MKNLYKIAITFILISLLSIFLFGCQVDSNEGDSLESNLEISNDSTTTISEDEDIIKSTWDTPEITEEDKNIDKKMDKTIDKTTDKTTISEDNSTSSARVYLNIYKGNRTLELWRDQDLIGEYRIGLGFDPVGHKEKEGDGKTPEGSYYVCSRNSKSKFYLSLGLSYPSIPDAERGLASNMISQSQHDNIATSINEGKMPPWNTSLGGEIMVHGSGGNSDWTRGCIAVDNDIMDILWEHCSTGTTVTIYP